MEDIKMENLNREEEQEQGRIGQEEETSFIEDQQRMDESILIIDGSNPIFNRPDVEEDADLDIESRVKKMGKSDGKVRRYIIHTKKQFLKDGLGITVNKGDGPSSTTLYDELRTTTSNKNGKINGASYKGKKILIMKNGKMEYSTDLSKVRYVSEFKELLKKAHAEHQKTPAALAEKYAGVDLTQETMDDITSNVNDRIESRIDDMVEDITNNTEISVNELRELRGILDVKGNAGAEKLKHMKIESKHWKDEAEKEGDTPRGKLFEAISRVADLKIDELRMNINLKPESEEVESMVEEEVNDNVLTKLERFKQWSRENMLTMSAVAISIASIITSIIVSVKNTLKKGAQAVSKFGKAVANTLKKFGPVISALGSLVAGIIKYMSAGLKWGAENLFILFIAATYLVYNEYKDYRSRNSKTNIIKKR